MRYPVFISLLCFILLSSCEIPFLLKHPVEKGDSYYIYATYYGPEYKGKKTANEEQYKESDYTCAIKGMPFGTILEVENFNDGRKVVVRVNDRPEGNVIDLTPEAFGKIGDKDEGKLKVKVLVIGKYGENSLLAKNDAPAPSSSFFVVQLGAFSKFEKAKDFRDKIGGDSYIYVKQGDSELYKVRTGKFQDKTAAQQYIEANLKGKDAIVVEVSE